MADNYQQLKTPKLEPSAHNAVALIEPAPPHDTRIVAQQRQSNSLKRARDELETNWYSKKPARPGIPKWRNLHTAAHVPEHLRYPDYELFKMRRHCQEIMKSYDTQLIHKLPIHSFACNVLCKHKNPETGNALFIPIEIAIHRYSIKSGQQAEPYHVIIDSGEPPSGCFNSSTDHSNATHKIAFPPRSCYPEGSRTDYKQIYKEMLEFVKPGHKIILINDCRDTAQVIGCIEWLWTKADDKSLPKVSTWTVLSILQFASCLHNYVYQDLLHNPTPKFAIQYYIKQQLQSSLFDYDSELYCEYHKIGEVSTKWCAQSCAIRNILHLEPVFEEIYKMYEFATNSMLKLKDATEEKALVT